MSMSYMCQEGNGYTCSHLSLTHEFGDLVGRQPSYDIARQDLILSRRGGRRCLCKRQRGASCDHFPIFIEDQPSAQALPFLVARGIPHGRERSYLVVVKQSAGKARFLVQEFVIN